MGGGCLPELGPGDVGEEAELKCAVRSFLLPANVAADVTGGKALFSGAKALWVGVKLAGVYRALGLGNRFLGRNLRPVQVASTNALAYLSGSATYNFPLAAVGDAVDGSVSLGSLAKDFRMALVPGSNTASAIGSVVDAC